MITVVSQILGFIGSLCLLLFGMEMLSNGIQKGAGSSLQSLLHKISGNRFTAILTGLAVTAIIQSSGATTVMVVSFVNAEIISLTQAIGIIFGANIGTTVTAWIVSLFGFSFSIEAAAIPLFGFGFILKYFKKLKIHNFSDCFMGFALLFMALGLLKTSMNLKPESVSFLQKFQDLKHFFQVPSDQAHFFYQAMQYKIPESVHQTVNYKELVEEPALYRKIHYHFPVFQSFSTKECRL